MLRAGVFERKAAILKSRRCFRRYFSFFFIPPYLLVRVAQQKERIRDIDDEWILNKNLEFILVIFVDEK